MKPQQQTELLLLICKSKEVRIVYMMQMCVSSCVCVHGVQVWTGTTILLLTVSTPPSSSSVMLM